MNRTQAKARAAELGISKEEARAFGNLSKTQTWLDALSAHEALLQSATEAAEYSDGEITEQSEAPEIQSEQHPAVEVLEETNLAAEASALLASPAFADEETFLTEHRSSSIVAEASVLMLPDPWDEPEALIEPVANAWSSGPIEPLDATAAASTSQPMPEKKGSAPGKAVPDASALVYPLLLFGLAVWAAYQLLVGLGSLVSVGLHQVARQFQKNQNVMLIPAWRGNRQTWDVEWLDDSLPRSQPPYPKRSQYQEPEPQEELAHRYGWRSCSDLEGKSATFRNCGGASSPPTATTSPSCQTTA